MAHMAINYYQLLINWDTPPSALQIIAWIQGQSKTRTSWPSTSGAEQWRVAKDLWGNCSKTLRWPHHSFSRDLPVYDFSKKLFSCFSYMVLWHRISPVNIISIWFYDIEYLWISPVNITIHSWFSYVFLHHFNPFIWSGSSKEMSGKETELKLDPFERSIPESMWVKWHDKHY